jgi:hypothetical protein
VVTDQPHVAFARIRGKAAQIEVGIRLCETEMFAVRDPVAIPAAIPALDQHAAEAIPGRKVDVALRVGGSRAMFVAAAPGGLVEMHLPPDTDVFAEAYPRGVAKLVWLVEIELDARVRERHGRFTHEHHAPRRGERTLLAHQHAI